jgi:hypothetical protein
MGVYGCKRPFGTDELNHSDEYDSLTEDEGDSDFDGTEEDADVHHMLRHLETPGNKRKTSSPHKRENLRKKQEKLAAKQRKIEDRRRMKMDTLREKDQKLRAKRHTVDLKSVKHHKRSQSINIGHLNEVHPPDSLPLHLLWYVRNVLERLPDEHELAHRMLCANLLDEAVEVEDNALDPR